MGVKLGDHIRLAAPNVLVCNFPGRSGADAEANGGDEFENHSRVQAGRYEVVVVPQHEGLVGEEGRMRNGKAKRTSREEPRVVIVDGEGIGFNIFGSYDPVFRAKFLAHLQGFVGDGWEP